MVRARSTHGGVNKDNEEAQSVRYKRTWAPSSPCESVSRKEFPRFFAEARFQVGNDDYFLYSRFGSTWPVPSNPGAPRATKIYRAFTVLNKMARVSARDPAVRRMLVTGPLEHIADAPRHGNWHTSGSPRWPRRIWKVCANSPVALGLNLCPPRAPRTCSSSGLDRVLNAVSVQHHTALWFGAHAAPELIPQVDELIRERFRDTMQAAESGELDGWESSPRRRLALIVLLDQFSRHFIAARRRRTPQITGAVPERVRHALRR